MTFFGNRRPNAPTDDPEGVERTPAIPSSTTGFETVLGASSTFEGTLTSEANVRLDGTFTGTLDISGSVLVGETAQVTADIHARNISIAGTVRGDVRGKKVQLLSTARVWGDISATALATEEGAFIDGKITMGEAGETAASSTTSPLQVDAENAATEAPDGSPTGQQGENEHDHRDDSEETPGNGATDPET